MSGPSEGGKTGITLISGTLPPVNPGNDRQRDPTGECGEEQGHHLLFPRP